MGKHKLENLQTEIKFVKQLVLYISTLPTALEPHPSATVLETAGLENCRVKRERNRPCKSSAMVNRVIIKQNPDQPSLAPVSSQLAISDLAVMFSSTFQQRNQQAHQKNP